MALLTCAIILIFCAISPLEATTAIPKISYVGDDDSFIEGKSMTFVCQGAASHSKSKFVWFLRDAETKEKIFYTNSLAQKTSPAEGDKDGSNRFSLTMRRDFSFAELVCIDLSIGETSLKLPKIKETIPIEEVNFIGDFLRRGDEFQLQCSVKAAPGIVKSVFFRNEHGITEAATKEKSGDGWAVYSFTSHDAAQTQSLNGSLTHCLASTTLKPQIDRIVVSKIQKLFLNNIEILETGLWYNNKKWSSLTVDYRSEIKLTCLVRANARPQAVSFAYSINDVVLSQNFKTEIFDVFHPNQYLITITLSPTVSGSYRIVLITPTNSASSSRAFSIGVNCDNFKENVKLEHNSIEIGKKASLDFYICAKQPPMKNNMQVQRLNSRLLTKDDIVDVLGVNAVYAAPMDKHQAALSLPTVFHVKVDFLPPEDGTYKLVVMEDGSKYEGPRHDVQISNKMPKTQPKDKGQRSKLFKLISSCFTFLKSLFYFLCLAWFFNFLRELKRGPGPVTTTLVYNALTTTFVMHKLMFLLSVPHIHNYVTFCINNNIELFVVYVALSAGLHLAS